MKKKKAVKGKKVQVYAAIPKQGAFYRGADGVIQGPWVEDGEKVDGFVKVKMDGSNDVIAAHHKQLREL